MPSNSETGHAKNVANFFKMNTACTGFGSSYNPSNPNISLKALTAKYIAGDAAVKAVEPFKKPFKDALDARQLLFSGLTPLVRSAFGVLKSCDGVSATTISDAYMLVKKIAGTNRPAPEKKQPVTTLPAEKEAEPAPATHSTSQQSFDMRLANYNDFVSLLTGEPLYITNEADITTAALSTVANNLKTVNDAVISVFGDYSKSLNARDVILYMPETGLVALAAKVKSYVSGISGLSATDKKLVSGLKFNTPGKKYLHF